MAQLTCKHLSGTVSGAATGKSYFIRDGLVLVDPADVPSILKVGVGHDGQGGLFKLLSMDNASVAPPVFAPAPAPVVAPAAEDTRCIATTHSGVRCKREAVVGSRYCRTHQAPADEA